MNITVKKLIELKRKIKVHLNDDDIPFDVMMEAIDREFDNLIIELTDAPVQTPLFRPRSESFPVPLDRAPTISDRTSIQKKTSPFTAPNTFPYPRQDFELPQVLCVSTCMNDDNLKN